MESTSDPVMQVESLDLLVVNESLNESMKLSGPIAASIKIEGKLMP